MFDIAIIIVNYKMKDHIRDCLSSLYKDIENSDLKIKLVVVDNNSNDEIESFLKENYPEVKVILQTENLGFGKSQNAGMRAVDAKYYFALNPDTVFPEGQEIVKRMFEFMEANKNVGIIGPKILYPDGELQYSCYRFPGFWQPIFSRTKFGKTGRGKKVSDHFLMKDFDHNSTKAVDWIMGSAMFVCDEAIKKVGMFDDRFWMYAEDSDWCRRMWEAGWPVYYVHDIIIKHAHGRGSAKVPGILRALIKNKLARVHLVSWLKYMWKWKGNHKYYKSLIK